MKKLASLFCVLLLNLIAPIPLASAICPPFRGIYSSRLPPEGLRELIIAYNIGEGQRPPLLKEQKLAMRGVWYGQLADGRCEERELTFKAVDGRCLALSTFDEDSLFEVLAFKATGHPENMRIHWREAIYSLEKIDRIELPSCSKQQGQWPPR